MSGNITITGVVVEQTAPDGLSVSSGEGLYLQIDNGEKFRLINAGMMTQMPVDILHLQSRQTFEPYLGEKITVSGYRSGSSIYNACIEEAADVKGDPEWQCLVPEK